MIVVRSQDLPPPNPNPQPPTEQIQNMTQPVYQQQPGALPPQAPPYPQAPGQGAPVAPWAGQQPGAAPQQWTPPPAPQAPQQQAQPPVWVPPPGYGDPNAPAPQATAPQWTPPPVVQATAPAPAAAPEQPKRRGRKPKGAHTPEPNVVVDETGNTVDANAPDGYDTPAVRLGELLLQLQRLELEADTLDFRLTWSFTSKD